MATNQFPFDGNLLTEKFHEGDPYAAAKTQEQANIDTVNRIFTALSVNDLDTFRQELHPDVELEINCPEYFPWIRRARGVEEMIAAVVQNFGVLDQQTPTIVSLTAQGDMVELCADETGHIRGLDRPYSVSGLIQIRLRDGKAVHVREVVSDRLTSLGG